MSIATAIAGQTGFPQTYIITERSGARARECATSLSSCRVITTFSRDINITVTGIVEGVAVNGSTSWLAVDYQGRKVYIHSSLARVVDPASEVSNSSPPVTTAIPVSTGTYLPPDTIATQASQGNATNEAAQVTLAALWTQMAASPTFTVSPDTTQTPPKPRPGPYDTTPFPRDKQQAFKKTMTSQYTIRVILPRTENCVIDWVSTRR